MVKQYRQAYPKWADEKVYEEAASHVNSLFGGINWRYLGRYARTQDLMRLASLSPDWTESNVRLIGRALGPTGAVARRQLARLAVTVWLGTRIANYLTSGQPHNETPFGVAVTDDSGKEHVYTMRSPITDALHFAQDPGTATWVFSNGSNYFTTLTMTAPQGMAKVGNQWLDSYSAVSGTFTQSQPAFSNLSGLIGQQPIF